MIARLAPKTGEIKLVNMPAANALSYRIVVNSDGIPFFAEFSSNKLASIDPKTMEIHEYPLPNAGSRGGVVRNMMATRNGKLVLACSGADRIALVDVR